MASKKSSMGLGRGLDSLITNNNIKEESNEIKGAETQIDINKVEPNRSQPRKNFNEDSLIELSENIKQYGIIQPLLVKERDGFYEIIAGERRWRAARMAGLTEVPVIIKDISEQEIVEISLIENIQREDLNPIEEAQAYKRLLEEFNLKQDEVAERVNKSRTAVTNSMRLLKLDERVQGMLIENLISTGHARAILGLDNHDKQYEYAQQVLDKKLSVRDVEKEVKKLQQEAPTKKDDENILDPKLAAILQEQEEKLKSILGTKVSIKAKNKDKGKIEIEYYSSEILDMLLNKFDTLA